MALNTQHTPKYINITLCIKYKYIEFSSANKVFRLWKWVVMRKVWRQQKYLNQYPSLIQRSFLALWPILHEWYIFLYLLFEHLTYIHKPHPPRKTSTVASCELQLNKYGCQFFFFYHFDSFWCFVVVTNMCPLIVLITAFNFI